MIITVQVDTIQDPKEERERLEALITGTPTEEDATREARIEELQNLIGAYAEEVDRIEEIAREAIRATNDGAMRWRRALGQIYELCQGGEVAPDADPTA